MPGNRRDARPHSDPIAEGALLAVVAAVLFGAATPVIRWAGTDAGPFPTAALLYAGASIATLPLSLRPRRSEAPVRAQHARRLLVIALFGGALAPASFAWGLQRVGGTSASLLLNFEAIFTALIAWRLYGESLGSRVLGALALTSAGGAVLVLAARSLNDGGHRAVTWGAAAVVAATLGWAFDNALTRPLADLDPIQVVRAKGALGLLIALVMAVALGQGFGAAFHALALLASGAVGYGLSLRLYLLAQRRIGAARTGSLFALAPFVGAAAAWALGERARGLPTMIAGVLFGSGVYLHATERHQHRHTHARIAHEHAHRHGDGHHDHPHDPAVIGQHSHFHIHDEQTHQHAHGPDVHHTHRHEADA
ncbi:MAG TPA: DMT family transporter [Polyangiaceae bacterium]|nr:DMT family transporter [Polyangiaceae bacterium]